MPVRLFRVLPCRSQGLLTIHRVAAGLALAAVMLCSPGLYYVGVVALLLMPVYWAINDRYSIMMPLRVAVAWITTYLAMMIWIDPRMALTASVMPALGLGVLFVFGAGVVYGQLLKLAFDVFGRPAIYVNGPACRQCGYERTGHLWEVCPECGSTWAGDS